MNSQFDKEESLMNMGGFVLKEQRYAVHLHISRYKKSHDFKSPKSAKTTKRHTKRETTSYTKTMKVSTNGSHHEEITHSYSGKIPPILFSVNYCLIGNKGMLKKQVVSQQRR